MPGVSGYVGRGCSLRGVGDYGEGGYGDRRRRMAE